MHRLVIGKHWQLVRLLATEAMILGLRYLFLSGFDCGGSCTEFETGGMTEVDARPSHSEGGA